MLNDKQPTSEYNGNLVFINADDSKEKPSTKPSKRNLVLRSMGLNKIWKVI